MVKLCHKVRMLIPKSVIKNWTIIWCSWERLYQVIEINVLSSSLARVMSSVSSNLSQMMARAASIWGFDLSGHPRWLTHMADGGCWSLAGSSAGLSTGAPIWSLQPGSLKIARFLTLWLSALNMSVHQKKAQGITFLMT